MQIQRNYGTGRRKTAVARVYLQTPGKGKFIVNGKPFDEYFERETGRIHALQPLNEVRMTTKVDLLITVQGSGKAAQAGAVRLGIARALLEYEIKNPAEIEDLLRHFATDKSADEEELPALTIRAIMRKNGFLTRDARAVERKKIGLVKARKRPQYSKR